VSEHPTYHSRLRLFIVVEVHVGRLFADCRPVCLNTFIKLKQWLRVRHSGAYFGMFDCMKCLRLPLLPSLMKQASEAGKVADYLRLGQEFEAAKLHAKNSFCNAICSTRSGLTFCRVSCCCC
jgi:hypothetical protein